ncbi:MAG: hypothetical protein JWM11_1659 [Planctomycetaceae bacterium]|nr:hypothetical protein [Planctomycetaceae bacterium]
MKSFNIPVDTMVVTSCYATSGELPIVEVSHQDNEDGGSLWQFHCDNGDYSMTKMQLVRLETILEIDPTVLEIADLEMGATARRIALGLPWTIEKDK